MRKKTHHPLLARSYRLELGINLRAAHLIETRWKTRYLPLENALVDVTDPQNPQPAWFTGIRSGDGFCIRLVDITDLMAPKPPNPQPALVKVIFTEPDTGEPVSPFSDPPASWAISKETKPRWSPVFSRNSQQTLPTWDIYGESDLHQPIQLSFAKVQKPFRSFALSVALHVVRGPWDDHFIFDPEMIVSDTDVPTGRPKA